MSQDLFAEFTSFSSAPTPPQPRKPSVSPLGHARSSSACDDLRGLSFFDSAVAANSHSHAHAHSNSNPASTPTSSSFGFAPGPYAGLGLGFSTPPPQQRQHASPPPLNAAVSLLAKKASRPVSFHGSPSTPFSPPPAAAGSTSTGPAAPASAKQDPFAAFALFDSKPRPPPSPQTPTSNGFSFRTSPATPRDGANGGFGGFFSPVVPTVVTPPQQAPGPAPTRPALVAARSSLGELAVLAGAPATLSVPANDADEDEFGDFIDSPAVESGFDFPSPTKPSSAYTFPAQPPPRPQPQTQTPPPAATSLLDLGFTQPPPRPQSATLPSASPFEPTSPPQAAQATKQPSIPLRTAFDAPAPTAVTSTPKRRPRGPSRGAEELPSVTVLLTLFPPLFALPQTALLNPLRGVSYPQRQRVLAHPRTKEFLEGVCELGRVAGRIIAGRKRRHMGATALTLNASPKTAGRVGVKASNSNWEHQKEEREVKETVRLWNEQAGRLRAAMGKAVPELGDQPWRGGKDGDARCRLCWLAREEVLSVLKERTDRMGWWDGEWGGHGGCRAFWERHGKDVKK